MLAFSVMCEIEILHETDLFSNSNDFRFRTFVLTIERIKLKLCACLYMFKTKDRYKKYLHTSLAL